MPIKSISDNKDENNIEITEVKEKTEQDNTVTQTFKIKHTINKTTVESENNFVAHLIPEIKPLEETNIKISKPEISGDNSTYTISIKNDPNDLLLNGNYISRSYTVTTTLGPSVYS